MIKTQIKDAELVLAGIKSEIKKAQEKLLGDNLTTYERETLVHYIDSLNHKQERILRYERQRKLIKWKRINLTV